MERLIETLSTFFEKRIRSPFWIYFLLVLIYYLRKEIYVTLFVDEAILYNETGCSLASYLSDPFIAQDFCFVVKLVGKTAVVWSFGFVVSSVFAWGNKLFDSANLWVMNRIEKKLVFPKLKVRLKMQEEYRDISRFRQENTILRKEMNERFKQFTRKMEDEWEFMLKETDAKASEEFNRRVENVAQDILNTSFYKNNGEVVEGKSREEWDSLRRELLLLNSLGIVGSEGEFTSFGKSVQEHIRKSKRGKGTNKGDDA